MALVDYILSPMGLILSVVSSALLHTLPKGCCSGFDVCTYSSYCSISQGRFDASDSPTKITGTRIISLQYRRMWLCLKDATGFGVLTSQCSQEDVFMLQNSLTVITD